MGRNLHGFRPSVQRLPHPGKPIDAALVSAPGALSNHSGRIRTLPGIKIYINSG